MLAADIATNSAQSQIDTDRLFCQYQTANIKEICRMRDKELEDTIKVTERDQQNLLNLCKQGICSVKAISEILHQDEAWIYSEINIGMAEQHTNS